MLNIDVPRVTALAGNRENMVPLLMSFIMLKILLNETQEKLLEKIKLDRKFSNSIKSIPSNRTLSKQFPHLLTRIIAHAIQLLCLEFCGHSAGVHDVSHDSLRFYFLQHVCWPN